MARRRRSLSVFSLSFLDVMSCGFGAVVLIYLIINHATEEEFENQNKDQLAEIRKLDYEVTQGQLHLADVQQTLEGTQRRLDDAQRRRLSVSEQLQQRREALAALETDSQATIEHLNALKSDVESRREEVERLKKQAEASEGTKARTFVGEGNRQYLTGMKVGGNRIVIAVDTSASMLDDTIVNIVRRRNMSDERQRQAPKWQRAIRTVEWLAAQLPLESQFQIYGFNTEAKPLLADSAGRWLQVADADELDGAVSAMKALTPANGTSLENLWLALENLKPKPDNIYLVTDGLPTQGTRAPRSAVVEGRERLDLFEDAMKRLPASVPVNVIMFPMEGDPLASAAFWNLARITGGAYLSPSEDWP